MADHYFVAIYDDIKKRWYHDLWTDATGRDDGDVYDSEADADVWRYADNDIAPNEEEINGKAWDTFARTISSLPPIALEGDEEPDVIY